ncbi:hypothetical protein GCM10023185_32750 [Hymenobacter saemangeumensis]|uniref:STAS/SEC14 domain-containing protein n=1 Tax=Hymenobacter saemangeumensis TaxID=1084522 RepID=A0ABP8INF8_9BACT
MPHSILHSEPYGAILLANDVPCIVVQWHGFANSQQLRSLKDRGLALYTEQTGRTQPLGWICDTRHFSAVKPDDQQWLATDWNLRAFRAGVRHLCFVRPESVFGQMSVDTYIANTNANSAYSIVPAQHNSIAAAKRWLKQQLLATH